MSPVKQKIHLDFKEDHSIAELLGHKDKLIKQIEEEYNVNIFVLGNDVEISGKKNNVDKAAKLLNDLVLQINLGQRINEDQLDDSIGLINGKRSGNKEALSSQIIINGGKKIKPRTEGQKRYTDAIKGNTIVFGIGPAGTGKTYLALAMAVSSLCQNEIGRIILVKPVVEAGEKLGYLPGDIYDKVSPYLKPLYDALYEMLDVEIFQQYMDMGIIEVVPLAYMRGRTLNDSFIILDEAQNASPEQMKMFLTRLGFGSKVVITGDITQIDLPREKESGLVLVREILQEVNGIEFVELTSKDVIRHKLVQKIVDAYKYYEDHKEAEQKETNKEDDSKKEQIQK